VLAAVDKLTKLNNGTIHWSRRGRANGFTSLVITTSSAKAANDLADYFKAEDYSKNISVLTGREMYSKDKSVYNLHTNGKFPLDIRNLTKIIPDIRYAHTGQKSIRFTTKIRRELMIETLKEYNITASRLARKKKVKHSSEATFMAITQAGTITTLGSLPRPPTRRITNIWRNEDANKVMNSGTRSIFLLGLHVNMSVAAIVKTLDTWGFGAEDKANACWYYCGNKDTYAIAIKTERAEELNGKQRVITAGDGTNRCIYATANITGYIRCHSNGKLLTMDTKHRLVVPATTDEMFKKDFTIGGGNSVDQVIKELDTARTATRTKNVAKPPAERNQSTITFAVASQPIKEASQAKSKAADPTHKTIPPRASNQFSSLRDEDDSEDEEEEATTVITEPEAGKKKGEKKKSKKKKTKKDKEKDDRLAIEEGVKQAAKEKKEEEDRLRLVRAKERGKTNSNTGFSKISYDGHISVTIFQKKNTTESPSI
jgi:hypothetical protein